MKTLILDRFCGSEFGTYGRLQLPSGFECCTVERPFRYNKPFVSCIPAGRYPLKIVQYNKPEVPYDTVELVGVKGRTHILVHVANKPENVEGCIGIGTGVGYMDGVWAVTNSKEAFTSFWRSMLQLFDVGELEMLVRWSRWMGGDYTGTEE